MLIRSQEKVSFVESGAITIINSKNSKTQATIINTGLGGCTVLGRYKTIERALEIIDEIESFALNGSKYDIIAGDGKRYYKEKTFHMPEK